MPSAIKVSEHVIDYVMSLEVYDNSTEAEFTLITMVKSAANCTHQRGNKRFEGWIFKYSNRVISSAYKHDCELCGGQGEIMMRDIEAGSTQYLSCPNFNI